MSDFLRDIVTQIKDEDTNIAADGKSSGEFSGYIDTGSYALNALYSGSIFKGLPENKISALAGEESTGKTYFALGIIKNFLDMDPQASCVFFESEGSLTKEILKKRGIDTRRVLIAPVDTIAEFKTQALRVIERYTSKKVKERKPLFLVLDSMGNLSTTKEMGDTEEGKTTKDMTRAPELRSAFRVLTLKLSKANVPMIVTNHTYQTIGFISMKQMSGGGGLKYAANNITFLSKSQEKEGKEVVGAIIKCKTVKSRLTKEKKEISTRLYFDKGLDRYYGLVDIAIEAGIWKKLSRQVDVGSEKVFKEDIYKNPEKFFTEDILQQIDNYCQQTFLYGSYVEEEDVIE